jgi:predicted  nucleic acid-binding Zn-ribbon protein
MGRGHTEKAGRNRVNLFKIFGEITLKGASVAIKDLAAVNDSASTTSKKIQGFANEINDAGKSMTLWATGPIVAVGTAILGMATQIGNAADRILDLNAITGMSTQAIQEWQYAAGVAGTTTEAATNATLYLIKSMEATGEAVAGADERMRKAQGTLQKMGADVTAASSKTSEYRAQIAQLNAEIEKGGKGVDKKKEALGKLKVKLTEAEAAETKAKIEFQNFRAEVEQMGGATTPAAKALAELGIEFQSLKSMSADAQLETLVARLQEIEDPVERARQGVALFGKQWKDIAPIVALGAEGLDKARAAGAAFAENEEQLNAANNFRIAMFELKTIISEVVESLSYALLPAAMAMVEVFRDNALPVIVTLIGYLQTAAEWFGSLPGPVQATIVTIVGLVAAIGPALLILAKIITIGGTMVATFVKIKAAIATAGVAIAAIATPIGAIILAVTAAILIFKNWEGIIAGAKVAWKLFTDAMDDAWKELVTFKDNVIQWGSELYTDITGWFSKMGEAVVKTVSDMTGNALGKLMDLYNAAVGNSIIPDLVKGVSDEMKLMAANGDKYANQFADTVQSALTGISAPDVAMAGASAAGGRSGQAMSTVSIDMRGSIFRDDKDMLRRLDRGGAGMQGF